MAQSIAEEVKILLNKPLEQFDVNQEIPEDYLKISPKVSGKLIVSNASTLLFQPEKPLTPATEYVATLALNKLYPGIAKELSSYTFSFTTRTPNFKIDVNQLQSYSRDWQYLTGKLKGADIMPTDKVKEVLKASLNNTALNIKWEGDATMGQYFSFTIDSIPRADEDATIAITWDGKPVDSKTEGKENFTIPGKNKFVVVDAKTTTSPPSLTLNFSEPLDEEQNLNGLVTIENSDKLRFEIDGNVLHVYPNSVIIGEVKVSVYQGLKNSYGNRLSKSCSVYVSFEHLKPHV